MKIQNYMFSIWLVIAGHLSTIVATPLHAATDTPTFHVAGDNLKNFTHLSLTNGPLRSDAKTIRVQLDQLSVARVIARLEQPEKYDVGPDFYREKRKFNNPSLQVTVSNQFYASETSLFPIENSDIDEFINIKSHIENIRIFVTGTRDIYKCFDTTNCVFERSITYDAYSAHDQSVQYKLYDQIFTCDAGGITVEQKIGSPHIKTAVIANIEIRNYLEINGNLEGPANSGNAENFSSTVASFAGEGGAYRTAYVFEEYGGLKVLVKTKPYYWCHYVANDNYLTVAVRRSQRCPGVGDTWWVSGSSAGSDEAYERNWFFRDCRTIPLPAD